MNHNFEELIGKSLDEATAIVGGWGPIWPVIDNNQRVISFVAVIANTDKAYGALLDTFTPVAICNGEITSGRIAGGIVALMCRIEFEKLGKERAKVVHTIVKPDNHKSGYTIQMRTSDQKQLEGEVFQSESLEETLKEWSRLTGIPH